MSTYGVSYQLYFIISKMAMIHSNIAFNTSLDFTITIFEGNHASIHVKHNTSFCSYHPYPQTILLTPCSSNTNLTLLLKQPSSNVCPVGDKKIHFDNSQQSPTKQAVNTPCLHKLVQVINKPNYKYRNIINRVDGQPDKKNYIKSNVIDLLQSDQQTLLECKCVKTF